MPGSTSSTHLKHERLASPASREVQVVGPTCMVVLVGPAALHLRHDVEKFLGITGRTSADIAEAHSILEAVLMARIEGRTEGGPLILADVAQEIEQLESAIRSLRKVYPKARMILLSDPSDEVMCRKAKTWGSSDYLILPVDTKSLQRLFVTPPFVMSPAKTASKEPHHPHADPSHETARLATPSMHIADVETVDANEKLPIRTLAANAARLKKESAQNGHAHELELPTLPLLVQSVLLNDLVSGRPDFADRAVATLQSYVKWNGKLHFTPATSDSADKAEKMPQTATERSELDITVAVSLPHQLPFGTLTLSRNETGALAPPALAQGAHWLATLLSVGRRYEQLRSLAVTDELSGAYNRRYFNKFMTGLLERARTNRFRVTLLLFDIDDFKKYNDTYGHASGDAIIRELIQLLRACTRPHDLVARLGGDEFAVVYWDNEAPRQPNSEHPRDVLSATERFRKAIKAHAWAKTCKIQSEISISGGLATFPWDADSLEQLTAKADEALLRAKAAGKNVILLHGHERSEPRGEGLDSDTTEDAS